MGPHPVQRRLHAEEVTRRRRADEQQRYAASQRRGRIDPNPHQIEAVIFALRRIPEGGCILADEVGLGKTIEAGLVIAQVLAEGSARILLIVPKALLGQWQAEMQDLFGLAVREAKAEPGGLDGHGIFALGREAAGGDRGASALKAADPFDLVVVDEAHEIFAGIYKRFDREGRYREDSDEARIAHRVRGAIGPTPVLLLTATPIQNSLAELWGLVQYVEPTGTLLGRLPTFREVFCAGDDRALVPEQQDELRRRLATVLQRTLRRHTQGFLETPFVERHAELLLYAMGPEERRLYDEVTAWLLDPGQVAFLGPHRRLLLIGFHRRMASSSRALAASLDKVAERLREATRTGAGALAAASEEVMRAFAADLDDDASEVLARPLESPARGRASGASGAASATAAEAGDAAAADTAAEPTRNAIRAELKRVEGFAAAARALPDDGKARCLLEALRQQRERRARGLGSGRLVVFTESITTQDYLCELLTTRGGLAADDVTLFRGHNEGPAVEAALARWQREIAPTIPPHQRQQQSRETQVRLALVHEFKTRSHVLVATEAGAKGLNLQFCETVVNYDLPWNPQRIEQRIGRCHRYGQTRGVTVINLIHKDNEAEQLLFEILSQKLELFGAVLDSSDVVLHAPRAGQPGGLLAGVGVDFEQRLRAIYAEARSLAEVKEELARLRDTVAEERAAYEETQARTAELIATRFDDEVRAVFRRIQQDLPGGLERLDHDLERLVRGYLDALGVGYVRTEEPRAVRLAVEPSGALPPGFQGGALLFLGDPRRAAKADPLHLGHPLVAAAIAEARAAALGRIAALVAVRADAAERLEAGGLGGAGDPCDLRRLRGRRGRFAVTRVTYGGFEPEQRLLVTVLLAGERSPLPEATARALLALPLESRPLQSRPLESRPLASGSRAAAPDPTPGPAGGVPDALFAEVIDDAVHEDHAKVSGENDRRFERALAQIERFVEDQVLVLTRERERLAQRLEAAEAAHERASGPELRARARADATRLEDEQATVAASLERLRSGRDPDAERWVARAYERRYTRPEVERLIEGEISIP